MPLAEFAHVEADHRRFAVEEELGQGLGQLGLADAGRSQEEERADRPVGVLQAGAAAADGVGDGADRRVLVDQPQVDLVFQLQELFALGREHPGDGDAGPLADDLGDLFGIDLFLEQPVCLLGLAVALGLGLGDPFFQGLSLGVERGQGLELLFLGPLAALLHVADLVPGPVVLDLDRLEALANFLDVAQARLFDLPLAAQVLKLLLDLADLVLRPRPAVRGRALRLRVPSIRSANWSWSSRRWRTSISVGTDWSSIDSRLAASSTRSIALSGRKRSVM